MLLLHLRGVAGAAELLPVGLELERELLRLLDVLLGLRDVGLLGGEGRALEPAVAVVLDLRGAGSSLQWSVFGQQSSVVRVPGSQ